jgi:tetratricopeptide (TPR) repeat protein
LYEALAADFPGVPSYRDDLARTHRTLGYLYRNSDRSREAEISLRQALDHHRKLVDECPDVPTYQQGLAIDLNILGLLLGDLGRRSEAEEAYGQGATILTNLASRFPDEPSYTSELARAYLDLGELLQGIPGRSREAVLRNPGRLGEAEKAVARAVALHEQLAARYPQVTHHRDSLAGSRNTLGNLLRDLGRYSEAEEVFGRSLTVRRQLVDEFPAVPHYRRGLAITLTNLGILLKNTNRAEKAEEVYREALEIHKRVAADAPDIPNRQNEAAGAMVNLARLLLARKDFDGARRLLEEALPYHHAALKANPRLLVYRNFYRLNRWRMAETLLELMDHAGAAGAASQFLEQGVELPRDAYTAAGLLAGCARLAARDDRLSESKREEHATAYGDRALAALRQAVQKGFKDVARLKEDASLEPLRSREEFQKLVAGLEKLRKDP